ncbi:PREDICTED: SH3 domain-containing protein 19 isoform X1 [Thamnophis sirtalis]|uniref:SH3 domain-containing protein 19 isoform X1 n=1 Tax=Thamnophis sirtalis TaxID=35019 RepID=A0A6I9YIG1_9SAUR|nr:PREDICTED: SH3 domain-containing protein 19 isoform X1 [Thamnophis sirtalis]
MAEAWRLEEDEEERKEVARRHRRALLNPATDRSERNKPDHRSSGQGPLSSIKAAIKRTSRTTYHSEQQRERRRPEITIVAAEPLGPSSWFPGGNCVPQQGLLFQSTHSQTPWRTTELVPAEPPSYEQVIKEINQVPIIPASNNNAACAANSRCTTTSSTQTDFPEEIISNLPAINVKNNFAIISECKNTPAIHISQKPPRPSSSLINNSLPINEQLLVILEDQTSQETSSAAVCPVPKPRSKGNLKPVAKDNQANNQEQTSSSRSKNDELTNPLMFLLDNSLKESHIEMDNMDTDNNQSNILSRIKSFEMQGNAETSGLTKKPEASPRSLGPKPTISAKKPVVAPKPGVNRASGEWESGTEKKQKVASQEKPLHTEEVGSNMITKPELPKKPTLVTVKSNSNGLLNSGSGSALENTDGQRKLPIPAPRPLLPKKSVSFESPSLPMLPLKPTSIVSKPSIAVQSNAIRSPVESCPSSVAASPTQNITSAEGDLISFDDNVLSFNPVKAVQEISHSESDLTNLPSKAESAKEQPVQPAVVRKPTVIRIPSKPAKALNDILESPPPLPTEKPIGNTSGIAAGKLNNINIINKEPEQPSLIQPIKNEPVLPPRPVQGKIIPSRPSLPKVAPGRPPPPKSNKISSDTDRFPRSSSDVTLHKKPSMPGLGIKKTKSDDFKKHGSDLPPRPKPGHPLYNKYMLPVHHELAKEDRSSPNAGHLSYKESANMQKITDPSVPHAIVLHNFTAEHTDDLDLSTGDTVFLLEKIDDEWYRGKCKNRTGIFPASFVKIIIDTPGENSWKKEQLSPANIVGPRCRARFEYIGDLKDELSFSEGEVIILKGYINEEWAKGELRGTSGIFPLNFVDVIEDLPESGDGSFPLRRKHSGSMTQLEGETGQWCDALHDFAAETQEDLSFKKGDRILILEQLDSEWYRGRLNGKEGIFPAVFVHLCSGGMQSSESQGGKKPKAKALYDFQAENIDELSFKVGDIITSVESVDEEWMSGELQDKFGIFPKNFVQILHLS